MQRGRCSKAKLSTLVDIIAFAFYIPCFVCFPLASYIYIYICETGRVLELLVLLNEHWQKHRLGSYKLVLLHNTAFNTAEFAKSQASRRRRAKKLLQSVRAMRCEGTLERVPPSWRLSWYPSVAVTLT